jgi:hypothetical protein
VDVVVPKSEPLTLNENHLKLEVDSDKKDVTGGNQNTKIGSRLLKV